MSEYRGMVILRTEMIKTANFEVPPRMLEMLKEVVIKQIKATKTASMITTLKNRLSELRTDYRRLRDSDGMAQDEIKIPIGPPEDNRFQYTSKERPETAEEKSERMAKVKRYVDNIAAMDKRLKELQAIPREKTTNFFTPKEIFIPVDLSGWKYADKVKYVLPSIYQRGLKLRMHNRYSPKTGLAFYHPKDKAIDIYLKEYFGAASSDPHSINQIENTLRHELGHFTQDLLASVVGLKRGKDGDNPTGMPGRSIRTPEYDPYMVEDKAKFKELKGKGLLRNIHHLTDGEFWTDLNDSISNLAFKLNNSLNQPPRVIYQNFLSNDPFFVSLRKIPEARGKLFRATKELWKAYQVWLNKKS